MARENGELPTGDGATIHWERWGNPRGAPALYLHGGPGAGASAGASRYFNAERYDCTLFDQRGCGRSKPLVESRADLATNTTQQLIDDIELLRVHLGVERWTVLGGSWGSTLGLAYAQAHPERVSALVLACVTTTSRREVEWITSGVGRLFPVEWERFAGHIPQRLRGKRIVDAYAELLFDEDADVRDPAAAHWCAWEDTHVSLAPNHAPTPRFADPEYRLRFARLVTHYWRNDAFLAQNQLLEGMTRLKDIPGYLIHGRYDVSSPLETPYEVHRRWPDSTLDIIDDAGHGGASMSDRIIAALDTLAEVRC